MIRPPSNALKKENGTSFATAPGGYRWFFLNKGDLAAEKAGGRAAWDEDGGGHYFTCPHCLAINKAHADGGAAIHNPGHADIELSFIHNGRDLDSFSCEVCSKCRIHMWVTFVGAVHRKIWGALKRDKTKCPKCRKVAESNSFSDLEFFNGHSKSSLFFVCCGMRWK